MERLTTGDLQSLSVSRLEHRHRYLCAASLARGRVLDLACGVGYGAPILLGNPAVEDYVGVDVEYEAIAQARIDPPPKARFLQGSAFSLPFGDGSFDTIVSLETLEHLDEPARALAEFRRVLRPGGVLVGSVPTAVFEAFCTAHYGPNPFHLQSFGVEPLQELLGGVFPCVRVFVARVSLVAALYDAAGEQGPFHHRLVAEAPATGSAYGSYVFVASEAPLGPDVADRLGVLSIGGSYFEAERLQNDRMLAARLLDHQVAQVIRDKDQLVRERDALILQMEAQVMAKDARAQQAEATAHATEVQLAASMDRLRLAEAELEAARAALAQATGRLG
jgi:SAM-dependent methyltransferase